MRLAFRRACLLADAAEARGLPELVSQDRARIIPAALREDELALRFVGHATFVIETPAGLSVATDYNDYVRPQAPPDVPP